METLIIGAGAMGGLFATLLAPLIPVSLFTTNAEHAETINRTGLTLTGMDDQVRRTSARALTDPGQYGRRADLILICTKARSTGQAAEIASRLLARDGLVLTLQNGLGNLEIIQAAVGVSRAAAGITAQAATLLGPGKVRHAGSGPTVLGTGPGQDKKIAAVAALFNQAGIATTITEDVAALLWSKLIVNVATICAAGDFPRIPPKRPGLLASRQKAVITTGSVTDLLIDHNLKYSLVIYLDLGFCLDLVIMFNFSFSCFHYQQTLMILA